MMLALRQIQSHVANTCDEKSLFAIFVVAFFIFSIVLFPVALNGNEEHYFQMALRRVRPEQFHHYHAVFEHGLSRVLFEYIVGWAVHFLGYEGALYVSRFLLVGTFAWVIALVFRTFNFSLIDSAATILIFVYTGQELFGGEWLFKGVEPKTFAYVLVLLGLFFLQTKRYGWMVVAFVLATHFHFLVGVFWCGFALAGLLLESKKLLLVLRLGCIFSICTLPFLVLVASSSLNLDQTEYHLTVNYIYGAIRVPFHVAPFDSPYEFFRDWMPGLIALTLLLVLLINIRQQFQNRVIIYTAIVCGIYLLLAFIAAFVDRNTHHLAMLFLFRPNSLFLLLALFIGISYLRSIFPAAKLAFYRIALSIIPIMTVYNLAGSVYASFVNAEERIVSSTLREKINLHVGDNEIILIEQWKAGDPRFIRVHRDVERPTLAGYKYLPSSESDIIMWHKRISFREKFMSRGCDGASSAEYPVDYLIIYSDEAMSRFESCSMALYQDRNLKFIQLINKG